MARPGSVSAKKEDKQYQFDFVVGHRMARGKPVFTVRWSHPWTKEDDSELDTTNMNDYSGKLAEYCKLHKLLIPNQKKKQGARGKVVKKKIPKKVQKTVQKKTEVKKKPSWSWQDVSDSENGDDEEETASEKEEEDSLPDVNQRQPPAPVQALLVPQVAQSASLAPPSTVQMASVVPAAAPPAPLAAPVAAAQAIQVVPQTISARQSVLHAQAFAFAALGARFPQAAAAAAASLVLPRPPQAADRVAPEDNTLLRVMTQGAASMVPARPAAPAATANVDDDEIYLSDG